MSRQDTTALKQNISYNGSAPTYAEARRISALTATTVTLKVVPLDPPQDVPSGLEGCRPVLQYGGSDGKSGRPGQILWVRDADIVDDMPAAAEDTAGRQVHEYRLRPEATIVVESLVRVKASALGNNNLVLVPISSPDGGVFREAAVSGVYLGQTCSGGVTYDRYKCVDETGFEYEVQVAVGSC
ncbi:hypothetical protein QEZ54_01915 [Catellatospora sp. KI3]|uniref:hypothetical protein n=1 Tax=Catellatospora sp. KI3 TaxID=3041620 RepID=UPI0024824A5E|nr:hypothetical protein [Catellatospora sp. KI3]MDI1459714.1 hypothetical protein [Catellatospora sp. KI3]